MIKAKTLKGDPMRLLLKILKKYQIISEKIFTVSNFIFFKKKIFNFYFL